MSARRLEWRKGSKNELLEGLEFIAASGAPLAARAVKNRIDEAADRIVRNPEIYRPSMIRYTRECVVDQTGYTIIYEVIEDSVFILYCWHQRRLHPILC